MLAFLRAHLLVIAICLALLLLYTLAGFFLVPSIARAQLQSFVTQTLHQQLSLGQLRFNPFTFEASAHELRISEPDGRELVGFRHLYADAELASLWQRAVVLNEVDLSAPSIQVVVERDGKVNLTKLQPPPTPDESAADDDITPVRIGRFSLREGRIGIEDRTRPRPFAATIAPIRFALSDFKTDAGHHNGYQFAGTTARGERLDWNGEFTVKPLGSTGRFRVGELQLKTLESYVERSLPFRIAAGQADLTGNYRFELDPLNLDVTLPQLAVRDLALTEIGATSTAPIQAEDVQVQELAFSLQRQDVHVREVAVRGARIDVAREADGTISLMRLFESKDSAPADAAAAPPASSSEDSWRTAVDTVRIENASVAAEDRTVQPTARFELSSLNASIAEWHNGADAEMKLTVDTAIDSNSKLAATGTMRLDPIRAAAKIDLSHFDLVSVQSYVAQTAKMTVHSGALDVKGDVRFEATEPLVKAAFRGDVRVANFRATDDALGQDFIKWGDLAVAGIVYEHEPASLAIERISASQPFAHVIIAEDGSVNVSKVLDTAPAEEANAAEKQAAAPTTASPPMPLSVKLVQIENGSANFADRSIQPSFAARIVDLQGKVTGLSSKPSSRAKVALTGKVDEYAPVDINGELNVLAAAKYSDLAMNFRNMELTSFNPYSGKFAGYSISKGKLSTELKYRIEDRKLKADHHIVVDNLEFGAKTDSKDAAPIPIKLGVALLKDRNGVIDVNLPVTGTLDDPKFRLGPIIWKAVLGLLTKIVTAPFAALGELFGGGEELAYVDFAPGSAELNPAQGEKLGKLSKALAERPALRLDVPITASSNEDAAALAKAALAARIPPESVVDDAADAATQRKQLTSLEKTYRTVSSQMPAYPTELTAKEVAPALKRDWIEQAMLASLQLDASALDTLARERARAVQAALLTNTDVNPERVFITTERKASATPEGTVRMELKLE